MGRGPLTILGTLEIRPAQHATLGIHLAISPLIPIMPWVIRRRAAVNYSGRLPRPQSFDLWTETEGREVVTALASRRWFSVIGKRRAAKREIWRQMRQLAESGTLAGYIHAAVAEYGERIGNFALDRSSLPRASVDLRRLFVVPRAQYNAWALDLLTSRLRTCPEVRALKGGPTLITYFCFELLSAIDNAVLACSPSVRRPLRAGADWSILGVNAQVVWSVPFRPGPDWRGHYFLYEAAANGLTRARRKLLTASIEQLESGVAEFSRLRKSVILAERPERR